MAISPWRIYILRLRPCRRPLPNFHWLLADRLAAVFETWRLDFGGLEAGFWVEILHFGDLEAGFGEPGERFWPFRCPREQPRAHLWVQVSILVDVWSILSNSWDQFWGYVFDIWVIGGVQMADLLRDQLFGWSGMAIRQEWDGCMCWKRSKYCCFHKVSLFHLFLSF